MMRLAGLAALALAALQSAEDLPLRKLQQFDIRLEEFRREFQRLLANFDGASPRRLTGHEKTEPVELRQPVRKLACLFFFQIAKLKVVTVACKLSIRSVGPPAPALKPRREGNR